MTSLPQTMGCDEFLGPCRIDPSKGRDRRLSIVKPQVEASALVQSMEDAVQGDFRLVVTR
jgi:hypothetical protein